MKKLQFGINGLVLVMSVGLAGLVRAADPAPDPAPPSSPARVPWQGSLRDGSRIQVDPTTRRATTASPKGYERPLWDGIHKLQDGSTVIIRSGTAVPTTDMVEQWRRGVPAPEPRLEVRGLSPCGQLVRKVCGLHDECYGREACTLGRSLMAGYSAHLMQNPAGAEDADCVAALAGGEAFPACDRPQPGRSPSPCERLVTQACGPQNQCGGRKGCVAARKQLASELADRRIALNPDGPTPSGSQCEMALRNAAQFGICGP